MKKQINYINVHIQPGLKIYSISPKSSAESIARLPRCPDIQAARTGGLRIVLFRTLRRPEGVLPVDSGISASRSRFLRLFWD